MAIKMSNDLEEARRQRRIELTAARLAAPLAERQHWSAAIVRHLRTGFAGLAQFRIGFFSPFRGEPDIRAAVDEWRDAGAITALPIVIARHAPLEFRAWWPGAPMTRGVFDIPIPAGTAIVIPQVLLIPPLGFDAGGYRLGYGGGYYDRTLAALTPQPLKVAVAFELSRMDDLLPQPYDIAMDFVVTERGIYAVTVRGMELLEGHAIVSVATDAILAARGLKAILPSNEVTTPDVDPIECSSPPCYAGDFDSDSPADC